MRRLLLPLAWLVFACASDDVARGGSHVLEGATSDAERPPDGPVARTEPDEALPADLVRVPAGHFVMGGSQLHPDWIFNMSPLHPVSITRPLFVQRTPTTQAQFREAMGRNPSFFVDCGETCPVERISFFDALAWANARSELEGLAPCYELAGCEGEAGTGCEGEALECESDWWCAEVGFRGFDCEGYRLPSEAEQEYLIRAGTTTPWPLEGLATPARLSEHARWAENSRNEIWNRGHLCWLDADEDGEVDPPYPCAPSPVASYAPNAFGLYDTIGQLYEYGFDHYLATPYPSAAWQIDPLDLRERGGDNRRAVRGGSFLSTSDQLLSATRGRVPERLRSHVTTVRLVRTAGPSEPLPACEGDFYPPATCYVPASEFASWREVRATCGALRARPLRVENDRTNEWLAQRFAAEGDPVWLDVEVGPDGRAVDERGRPLAYQRWAHGERPRPGQAVALDPAGFWRAQPDGARARVVCVREESAPPGN